MIDYETIQAKKRAATYRVAVLSIIPGGAHGEVAYWLKKTNEQSDEMFRTYTYFSLGSDELSIKLTVQRILLKEYDLIISLGRFLTTVVHQETAQMEQPPPVIFCLTADPVEQGLIASMECSENNMVGVEMGVDTTQAMVEHFLHTCPNAQRVLLPFCSPRSENNASWYDRYVAPCAELLRAAGRDVQVAGFSHTDQALDAIESDTYDVDAIMVLQGDPLLSMYGPLGTYCSARTIVFCANSRGAVRCSAALGYSESYRNVGIAAAHMAQNILFDGENPSDISSMRLKSSARPMINLALAADQGLDVNKMSKNVTSETEVFQEKGPFPAPYDE